MMNEASVGGMKLMQVSLSIVRVQNAQNNKTVRRNIKTDGTHLIALLKTGANQKNISEVFNKHQILAYVNSTYDVELEKEEYK
jgi:hypothetical protein